MRFWCGAAWLSLAASTMLQNADRLVLSSRGGFVEPESAKKGDAITRYRIRYKRNKGLTAIAIGEGRRKFLGVQGRRAAFVRMHTNRRGGGLKNARRIRVREEDLKRFGYKIVSLGETRGDEGKISIALLEGENRCLVGRRRLEVGDCGSRSAVFRLVAPGRGAEQEGESKEGNKEDEAQETEKGGADETADADKSTDAGKTSDKDPEKTKEAKNSEPESSSESSSGSLRSAEADSGCEESSADSGSTVSIHEPGHKGRRQERGRPSVVVIGEDFDMVKSAASGGKGAVVLKKRAPSEEKMKRELEREVLEDIARRVEKKKKREKKKAAAIFGQPGPGPAEGPAQAVVDSVPVQNSVPAPVQEGVPAAAQPRPRKRRRTRAPRGMKHAGAHEPMVLVPLSTLGKQQGPGGADGVQPTFMQPMAGSS